MRPTAALPPEWLSPEARQEWGRLAPILDRQGLWERDLDGDALALLADQLASWKRLVADPARSGDLELLATTAGVLRELFDALGMTPASRAEIAGRLR